MAAFDALLDGYRRFRRGAYAEQRARYDALAHQGQAPKTMVVGCVDSRVDPTRIFDSAPGELFVLRNVANLVPPYAPDGGAHGVSAAIEFAVTQLGVEELVVLGHGRCGGITASLTGAFDAAAMGEGAFIGRWMATIDSARDEVRAAAALHPDIDAQRALELAAIRLSLDNLRGFPFVSERLIDSRLTLRGAHFDIADGILRVLDDGGRFTPVALDWS